MVATSRRHGLGQWFTPPFVADLALSQALAGAPAGARVLDPTCGDGVFLARSLAAGVQPGDVVGIDIDPAAAAEARARAPGAAVHVGDVFDAFGARWGADGAGRFDAVVGNPPYVRQERLSPAQKDRVRRCLAAAWPDADPDALKTLTGRADLAAPCLALAVSLVRPGGRVAFVVSGALLDADYAAPVWRLVRSRADIVTLIEAPQEVWFDDAAVNPLIVVLERRALHAPARPTVTVARLRVPTAEAARASSLRQVADVKVVASERPRDWSAALRAHPLWGRLRQAAGTALVPLGELASVRRGVTSGANDIFYMTRAQARERNIECGALTPLVRAPHKRTSPTIAVADAAAGDDSDVVALRLAADADLSALPGARAYIESVAAAAERPTLRSRRPWWALPGTAARLFLTKAYYERFVQQLAPTAVLADQRVYALHPRPGVDIELLAAALNASIVSLALESGGRASMGEGALEWTVADARTLPVPDVRRATPDQASALREALAGCLRQPVDSVAAELGKLHRRRLDAAAAALMPLGAPDADAIGGALIEAVNARVERASSRKASRP